jgi:uncharacterized protein (TIGR03085 family)
MADELSPVRSERLALCDLFEEVGPDAPTLCEGWTAADLAAHLVVREGNPIAGAGIVFSPLAGYTEKAMGKTKERTGFDGLVERIRGGPPFGMFRLLESQMNLNEYFVHHEDVRRGDGETGPRSPDEIVDLDEALWSALKRGGKFLSRGLKGVGVTFEWPEHGTIDARSGDETVTITGPPTEIVLFLNGRKSAARVELSGDDAAVARASDADLGI